MLIESQAKQLFATLSDVISNVFSIFPSFSFRVRGGTQNDCGRSLTLDVLLFSSFVFKKSQPIVNYREWTKVK